MEKGIAVLLNELIDYHGFSQSVRSNGISSSFFFLLSHQLILYTPRNVTTFSFFFVSSASDPGQTTAVRTP